MACTSTGELTVAPLLGLVIVTVPARAAGASVKTHSTASMFRKISILLVAGDEMDRTSSGVGLGASGAGFIVAPQCGTQMLAAVLVFVQADFEDFCCEFPGRESCS